MELLQFTSGQSTLVVIGHALRDLVSLMIAKVMIRLAFGQGALAGLRCSEYRPITRNGMRHPHNCDLSSKV